MAKTLEEVKIDLKKMTAIPQETKMTCWFAAYQMMLQWKALPTGTIGDYDGTNDPHPIKDKLIQAGIDWDDAVSSGLKGKSFGKAAAALGLQANGVGQQWTTQDLKRFLVYPSPILVFGNWNGYFHAVVVTKVEIDNDLEWDKVGSVYDESKLTYIDPHWTGNQKPATAKTVTELCRTWLPGSYAYKGIIGAWQAWKKT